MLKNSKWNSARYKRISSSQFNNIIKENIKENIKEKIDTMQKNCKCMFFNDGYNEQMLKTGTKRLQVQVWLGEKYDPLRTVQ